MSFAAVKAWHDSYGRDVAPADQLQAEGPITGRRRPRRPAARVGRRPAAGPGGQRRRNPGRGMREIIRVGREELRRRAEAAEGPSPPTDADRARQARVDRWRRVIADVGIPDPWAAREQRGAGATTSARDVPRRTQSAGARGCEGTGMARTFERLVRIGRQTVPGGASAP